MATRGNDTSVDEVLYRAVNFIVLGWRGSTSTVHRFDGRVVEGFDGPKLGTKDRRACTQLLLRSELYSAKCHQGEVGDCAECRRTRLENGRRCQLAGDPMDGIVTLDSQQHPERCQGSHCTADWR